MHDVGMHYVVIEKGISGVHDVGMHYVVIGKG